MNQQYYKISSTRFYLPAFFSKSQKERKKEMKKKSSVFQDEKKYFPQVPELSKEVLSHCANNTIK